MNDITLSSKSEKDLQRMVQEMHPESVIGLKVDTKSIAMLHSQGRGIQTTWDDSVDANYQKEAAVHSGSTFK